jgi:uncharacterized protein involved in exopolysaccharide biosynthesis
MNDSNYSAAVSEDDMPEDDFYFVDILLAIAKRKKLVLGMSVGAAVLSAAISFALPDVYKATTKLLPPQQSQSSAAGLLSQLGVAGAVAGLPGVKNPNDLYVGMLKSRTVADKLIAKFDLSKVYDKATMEKTRQKLAENTIITSGKDGLINIDVEDQDPHRAAQIANTYVEELLKLTKILAVTEASQRRVFFERQLETAKNNLASSEMMLKSALDKNGVISVDADSRAIVETIGRLRAQIAAREIQLSSMNAFVTANNPEYKRVQEELTSLREQFSKLQNGSKTVETQETTPGGLANIKILRDVKYYEMLYELLAKQYEVARLDEAKDSSVVQVLDTAIDPERSVRPHRWLIIAISTFAGLVAGIGIAMFQDKRENSAPVAEKDRKWKELKALL